MEEKEEQEEDEGEEAWMSKGEWGHVGKKEKAVAGERRGRGRERGEGGGRRGQVGLNSRRKWRRDSCVSWQMGQKKQWE